MYFIIKDGTQHGPFSKEELRLRGITPDTMVWREGMADWAKASTVPDLEDLFARPVPPPPSSYNPYGQAPVNPPYPGMAPNFSETPEPHTNWQPWAIVAIVCGVLFNCLGLILAIFAIVNANKANRYYAEGWVDRGASNNSSAKVLTIIALALEAISIGYLCFNWNSLMDTYTQILNVGGVF